MLSAEGSAAKVARPFEVTPQEVQATLRFEHREANRLAA
jgi:hypothetical protein